ncbi:MAG: hypothetical protein COA78_15865 [Blastopirellula sp.]|nr:MAG: hypothetical protein COA78_15865 [Blastopirellula sp.]
MLQFNLSVGLISIASLFSHVKLLMVTVVQPVFLCSSEGPSKMKILRIISLLAIILFISGCGEDIVIEQSQPSKTQTAKIENTSSSKQDVNDVSKSAKDSKGKRKKSALEQMSLESAIIGVNLTNIKGNGSEKEVVDYLERIGATIGYDKDGYVALASFSFGFNSKKISDLSPLSKLKRLRFLTLSNTQVTDISPLSNLTNLESLELSDTNVSDITPISNLKKLIKLNIYSSKVSDISPLSNLTNLHWLNFARTKVQDLSPLKNLSNLTMLEFYDCPIKDISPIANLGNITDLNLGGTQINDLTPLVNMKNLSGLFFDNTPIQDFSPLARIQNLKVIWMYNNTIPNGDLEKLKQAKPELKIFTDE